MTIDFNEDVKSESAQVDIKDLMGKRVYRSGKLSNVSKVTVGTHGYSSGTYIIRVSKGKQIVNKKLIIGQ